MNIKHNPPPFSFDSLNTTILAVFFFLLPIVFSNQVIETASLPRYILISSVACTLLFILAIQLLLPNKSRPNISKIHLALFVFYCWALLSIWWSVDPKNTITELTQLTVYFVIAFIASQLHINNQIKPILYTLFIGASIAALIGILQAFNFNPLELKITTPLASTFNNKNHAAVYFDLIIPIALITMLTTKSYSKYISSVAYTLALTFILLSKTKGSLLGFLVSTVFFIFYLFKNDTFRLYLFQKKKIIHYLFFTLVFPFAIYLLVTSNIFSSHIPSKWNDSITDSSASVRLSLYKNAYDLYIEAPLTGIGYGSFRKGFMPFASSPHIINSVTEDHTFAQLHNDPYQNFLELGLVGGGLIILTFSYIIFRSAYILSTLQYINKNKSEYLLLGTFLALTSSITHSFVDFPLHLPSSAALFWFITGITILLLSQKYRGTRIKISSNNKFGGILIVILSILFSAHCLNLYSRYFTASKLQYEATVFMIKDKNKDNCAAAREKIDSALNLFIESHSIRQRYAQIYAYCDSTTEIKLAAMNRILNYDSTQTRARLTRATLNMENKDFKNAQSDFEYLINVLPHRPAAYIGLGDISILNKKYTDARKYYEKAKELAPNNQYAIMMLQRLISNGI